MPLWQWIVDAVGLLLLLVLLYGIALVVRRRVLSRDGGTFELSYRARSDRTGRGWVLGLGRYAGDHLEWFRIFSLSPRPRCRWSRRDVAYVGRRLPEGGEHTALYAEHVIAIVDHRGDRLELAMSPSSLTGLQSWLEAGPPGTDWDQARRR